MQQRSTGAVPRAVELIRVSTHGQAERDTQEIQRRALDRLRETRPCVLVERLEALGVSGALAGAARSDLARLLELTKARAYDEIRVWSLDRLTRSPDPRERFEVYGFALDSGAKIVDASGRVIDPQDDSDIGELDYYLQTLLSARERKKIMARTRAGSIRSAQDGTLCQGSAPYGRRCVDGAWTIEPSEAAVYREIVTSVLGGRSTRAIAADLNRAGVPPARGASWVHSTIKRLLRSEAIVGRYRAWGYEIAIPAIVDEVTWARARAALTSHRSFSGSPPSKPALLRGVLRCGSCGLVATVISDGAGRSYRYGCPQASRRPAGSENCTDRRTIRVSVADDAVRLALLETLTSKTLLRAAVEDATAKEPAHQRDDSADAQRDIERLRGQEARLLRLLDESLVSEDVARKRLGEIRTATRAAEERRQRAIDASDDCAWRPASGSALEVAAASYARAIRQAEPKHWSELIRAIVPARPGYGIELHRDGIHVRARLPAAPGDLATTVAHSGQMPGLRIALRIAC